MPRTIIAVLFLVIVIILGMSIFVLNQTLRISDIEISDITEISAIISWNTNELSSSKVIYGVTEGSYEYIVEDGLLTHEHEIKLEWLLPDTKYHYKIISQDAHEKEAITNDNIFNTVTLPADKGIIVGTVIFAEGGLASDIFIYIFKDKDLQSLTYRQTDDNGRYIFTDLSFGEYEIYSSNMHLGLNEPGADIEHVYKDLYRSFNSPPEIVAVTSNQLIIAPTRTHFKDIIIHLQEEYANTNQPEISWNPVPTAAYYVVRIARGYLNEQGGENYERVLTVSGNGVLWPDRLVAMHYVINITAYDNNGIYLTDDYDSFWIGPSQ